MLQPGAAETVACPVCKGDLSPGEGKLSCAACAVDYPVVDGIPRLYPPSDALTIDPSGLRLKTRAESTRTLAQMGRIDHGFISGPRPFYAVYLFLFLALVLQLFGVALFLVLTLLADWLVFRWRRGRVLARTEARPLRLRSVADHEAVDELYRREGKAQPTMSDWVRLARSTADTGAAAGAPKTFQEAGEGEGNGEDQDDERYKDIFRVYRQGEEHTRVVVDVGANDGLAYYRFGVGKGKTFIGIDVSHLLLTEFVRRIPDQTALQADGVCLPLKSASVDFLFCTETLEHLSDPSAALQEFARVLRPGGRVMVQSPNAHRIRNLNAFHILTLAVSLLTDRVLQKKVVHENTWHNAVTYHWDFSAQDYRRMARGAGLRMVALRSRQFFFPRFLLGRRPDAEARKEQSIGSIPLLRMFGDDLVMVAVAPDGALKKQEASR